MILDVSRKVVVDCVELVVAANDDDDDNVVVDDDINVVVAVVDDNDNNVVVVDDNDDDDDDNDVVGFTTVGVMHTLLSLYKYVAGKSTIITIHGWLHT